MVPDLSAVRRPFAILLAAALLCLGCSSVDEPAASTTATAPVTTSSSSTVAPTSTTTTAVSTTTTIAATTTTTLPAISDPYVEVNGVRLVYTCRADGDIPVLVDQGLVLGDSQPPGVEALMGWDAVAEQLPPEYKFCVYNRRGVGQSDQPRNEGELRTSQNQVDDLIAVIEALDLAPVILVGHSISGFNLRIIAQQRPDLIAGQVYVDASHPDQVDLLPGVPPAAQGPEWLDIQSSADLAPGVGDNDGALGEKPIAVLTALQDWPADDAAVIVNLHADHAGQSATSDHIVLEDAGHFLFAESPEAVASAIEWVASRAEG